MLAEKAIRMASQLVMLVLLARFLGSEKLGQLMFCYSLASIFVFLNSLGLNSLLITKFVDRPSKRLSYLRHALVLRLIASVVCVFLVNFSGIWLVDDESRLLLLIISMYHLLLPFTIFEWFFQSEGRGDLSAIGLVVGNLVGFFFRSFCLYYGGSLEWLGFAYVLEMIVMAIVYTVIAKRQGLKFDGPISTARCQRLIKQALPLIISGAAVLLYFKVDQIMLGYFKGKEEVGIYVAGARLSEAWFFIGLTVIAAYFPKFLRIRKERPADAYHEEIVAMGRWLVWGAVILSILTALIADWLILLLYGSTFTRSSDVLVVSIWSVPFVYLGAIATRIYVAESMQNVVLLRSVLGLAANVVLNVFLINWYGAVGASISTLLSQIWVGYLFNVVSSNRSVFSIQSRILIFLKR